jgi:uncharacterized repeat protein (TIGR03837 family)
VSCVVPEGVATSALTKFFPNFSTGTNRSYAAGNLTLRIVPLLTHERYDRLLWACNVNFVRGEDSFVRAQWAARPFVWQIYPQKDAAHRVKLDAFIDLFCAAMDTATARATASFWHGWNGDGLGATAWRELLAAHSVAIEHAALWSANLALQTDLTSNLVNFSRDLLKLPVST